MAVIAKGYTILAKLLSVENLEAGHGPIEVLKGISIDVNEGDRKSVV